MWCGPDSIWKCEGSNLAAILVPEFEPILDCGNAPPDNNRSCFTDNECLCNKSNGMDIRYDMYIVHTFHPVTERA